MSETGLGDKLLKSANPPTFDGLQDPLQPGQLEGRLEVRRHLTAIIEREGNGYVALCPEVEVASQGDSVAVARANLQEAITLFLETASAEEIEERWRSEVYVTQVEVAVG